MNKFIIGISIFLFFTACAVVDEAEDVAKSLETVYENCKDENIDSLDDIENAIKANGNDLSLECRNSFQGVKLPELSSQLNLSVNLDSPFEEVLSTPKDKLFSFSALTTQNKQITLSGVYSDNIDLSALNKSDVQVSGIDDNNLSTTITDFDISNPWDESPIAVSYVQDYSGSMFASQLTKIGNYMQDFDGLINTNSKRSLIRFADDVIDVSQGFTTNATSIRNQLDYDSDEVQGATSLYDAWGNAINQLNAESNELKLVIIATDGGENDSENFNKSQLRDLAKDSNVFHVVFGSFFARKSNLVDIIGDKGILLYTFQVDALKDNIDELNQMLQKSVNIQINEDINGYESIQVTINGVETEVPVN